MNFQQFVHEVTDIILALNKNKIYANFTIHVGRSKCEYFDDKNEDFETVKDRGEDDVIAWKEIGLPKGDKRK